MIKSITIFFLFFIWKTSDANNIFPRFLTPKNYNIDSLKSMYGKHKTFIPEFELQTLIALSGYPELKDDFITFKYHHITTTGKTSITTNSILDKQHHYVIYITTKTKGKSVLLKDAPFNAQVGLLAHELGHIADFKTKKAGSFITWALNITLSKKDRAIMEKQTDQIAIEHGFGWQLFDWIDFVLNKSTASEKYKKFKRRFYLQPSEIASIINGSNPTRY